MSIFIPDDLKPKTIPFRFQYSRCMFQPYLCIICIFHDLPNYVILSFVLGIPATKAIIDLSSPEPRISNNNIPRSASPHRLKSPLPKSSKSSSPASFVKPTKTVGVKSSRRRSSKYHVHNQGRTKKLLSISKSTNVLTPSKHFVAPMASQRKSTSHLKFLGANAVKPATLKKDENTKPEKEVISS